MTRQVLKTLIAILPRSRERFKTKQPSRKFSSLVYFVPYLVVTVKDMSQEIFCVSHANIVIGYFVVAALSTERRCLT